MSRSVYAFLLSLFCTCAAWAEEYKSVNAALSLDEAGSVSSLEFKAPVAPKLEAALRARVDQWRFSPVLVEGEPRAATLNLAIKLGFSGDGDRLQARVVSASTGLRSVHLSVPSYPRSELKAQRSGNVVLKLVVDVDGTVAQASAIHATNRKFERAAIRAASQYRFEPLLVDGKPARGEIYMPAQFFVGTGPIPLPELPELAGSELNSDSGTLVADHGGRLTSPVQGVL